MSRTTRSASRRSRTYLQVQKPNGTISDRVRIVGPECFAILSIDAAKQRFKMMLCDFYGQYLIPPTEVDQSQGGLHTAIDRVREALAKAGIRDQIVAIERTGEYHRPVQRAFRNASFEARLVHPFASKQFRQAANPGNKTDDTANAIIGRAGLFPSRYQSDRVDHDDGEIIRCANRRLRTALMQIADNLVANNRYFRAKAALWREKDKDARWMRVKVAKQFSRIAYAIVSAGHILAHSCLQDRHYVLQKLNAFHGEHHTPTATLLDDIRAAVEQLPLPERTAEAKPLQEEIQRIKTERRRSGPELLTEILLIVLARLTGDAVQSKAEGLAPS